MSKCCGIQPTLWIANNWVCSNCSNIVIYDEHKLQLEFNEVLKKIEKSTKCDCGASKTINTNCHALWCSAKGI